MKLIIDISEGIYKHVDTIQNGSIGAKQIINSVKNGIPAYKAIPSAYKGMTNGQVITKILKDAEWAELTSDIGLVQEDTIYIKVGSYWWNSPYESQERSNKE